MTVSMPATTEVALPAGPVGERLESQLRWHDGKAVRTQRKYKGCKLVQLTAAAAVPIAAAVSAGEAVTAGLGGLILVVEGMQQIGQYHRNWISARATCEALQRERALYLGHAGNYARARDPERLLAERVETIVGSETAGWTAMENDAARDEQAQAAS